MRVGGGIGWEWVEQGKVVAGKWRQLYLNNKKKRQTGISRLPLYPPKLLVKMKKKVTNIFGRN